MKHLIFSILLITICSLSLVTGFNIKSIIFGDKEEEHEASVPFGTPITEGVHSNREGSY